jgi:phosphatidylglycerophosphate synthase
MIQVGIKRIVMAKQDVPEKWKESWYLSRRMCEEADIKIDFIITITLTLLGTFTLWIACVLTLVTGYRYTKAAWPHLQDK